MRRTALLTLALLILCAAPARAATVTLSTETFDAQRGDQVLVYTLAATAAAGEANDVALALTDEAVTFRDTGAPVTAGKGCAAVDAATVRCALVRPAPCLHCGSGRIEAALALGDRDDRATVSTAPGGAPELLPTVDAGAGDDVVIAAGILDGGPGDDRLTGSASDDGLDGGPGNDTLLGLGGEDDLAGDTEPQDGTDGSPHGNDTLDGGAGLDGVVYSARRRPVTIDLAAGMAGEAGELDRLVSVEKATGGAGADRITGTDAVNWLDGGAGADVIRGLAGADTIVGGRRIDAGGGDDRLIYPRGSFDCGAGADAVAAGPQRPLPPGCERAELDVPLTAGARPVLRHGMVVVRTWSTCDCTYRGTLTVRRGGRLLARGRVRVRPGSSQHPRRTALRAPLTAAGVRAFARRMTVTVSFKSQISAAQGYRARLGG